MAIGTASSEPFRREPGIWEQSSHRQSLDLLQTKLRCCMLMKLANGLFRQLSTYAKGQPIVLALPQGLRAGTRWHCAR